MVETATGVVLRTRPLTETSLIVHWLTPNLGRLATVAKGARRPKSPFLGKLDILYLADFSFSRSRRSELHVLREITLRDTHAFLRQDLGYLQQAAYCIRLIEQTTETETPLLGLHELLIGLVQALPDQACQPRTVLAFELKLLNELGLHPDWTQTGLRPETQTFARELEQCEWRHLSQLPVKRGAENDLTHYLRSFLLLHLGRIPKGREHAIEARLS
jgi:DNA repair protein RecO (recombination protein O)